MSLGAPAQCLQRHHQLAGFGAGHPRAIAHAPDAQAVDHEVVPALLDPGGRRRTAHGATENGVVPVHRVAVLLGERLRVRGDRVTQPAQRQLPLRLRVVDQAGQRQRTPDAVEHAGAPGQQSLRQQAGFASRPSDLAVADLHVDDEVDGLAHHRPHLGGKRVVTGDQHVMPHPGGDVGAKVAVAVGVFDDARAELDGPGAVGPLGATAPFEGRPGRLEQPGGGERHRALHVVPRIGVAAVEPGDGARRFLLGRDRQRGLPAFLGCEHPGDRGQARPMQWNIPRSLGFSRPVV